MGSSSACGVGAYCVCATKPPTSYSERCSPRCGMVNSVHAHNRNPADVVEAGKSASVAVEALLDLGDRGVRALQPAGPGKYLILAGKFDDTKDFALFLWVRSSNIVRRVLEGAALNALNPEELLLMPQTAGDVNLLSDDDVLVGGIKCKKASASERSFRITPLRPSI